MGQFSGAGAPGLVPERDRFAYLEDEGWLGHRLRRGPLWLGPVLLPTLPAFVPLAGKGMGVS